MANLKPQPKLDSDGDWMKIPYGVMLGSSFTSYRNVLLNTMALGFLEADERMTTLQARQQAERELAIMEQNDKSVSGKPSVNDASVGGNDAINPTPCYGLDDDIVPLMHNGCGEVAGYGYRGMGRVYSEIHDGQQRILWLTMGVPHYTALEKYFAHATAEKLAVTMENGYVSTAYKIGALLGEGVKLAFYLPWYPLIWTFKIGAAGNTFPVSEYIRFYQTMPLYYRMVNEILSRLAVNMGLWGNASSQGLGDEATAKKFLNNLPEIAKNGPDIFAIMNKRTMRLEPENKISRMSGDQVLDEQTKAVGKGLKTNAKTGALEAIGGSISEYFDALTGSFKGTALGGSDFIGFKIEKSTGASESFSNQTKETQLASDLNGYVGQRREITVSSAGGQGFFGSIDAMWKGLQNFIGNTTSLRGNMMNIYAGNGYYDLPSVWSNSSFSKSYNFRITLRAKYGDPVSIFQSIYVPLACLLAAALPRGTGSHSYTSPFNLRAYVRGMFAVPYGIIDNLSIQRGDAEFGWNHNNMPTVIHVDFSILDLSPVLFMNLSASDVAEPLRSNTKFNMYLDTLAGIGLKERYFRWDTFNRRATAQALIKRNTWLSATYHGLWMGDSAPIKTFASLAWAHRVVND